MWSLLSCGAPLECLSLRGVTLQSRANVGPQQFPRVRPSDSRDAKRRSGARTLTATFRLAGPRAVAFDFAQPRDVFPPGRQRPPLDTAAARDIVMPRSI